MQAIIAIEKQGIVSCLNSDFDYLYGVLYKENLV